MFSDDYEAYTRLQRERPGLVARVRQLEAENTRLRRWAQLWRLAAMIQHARAETLARLARRWRKRLLGRG